MTTFQKHKAKSRKKIRQMNQVNPCTTRYYNLSRHWTKRIVPHLADEELNTILAKDFNKFTWGRWRQKFTAGMHPRDFETCDWSCGHKGKEPQYWRYVKHAACHWLANFTLKLANLAEPKHTWRIITSPAHSTVWDGEGTLFDFNFQAMGIAPQECFDLAYHIEMQPGAYIATCQPRPLR